jgi:hypothetical protein
MSKSSNRDLNLSALLSDSGENSEETAERSVTIQLSQRVIASQPLEASAEGGHPACNKVILGPRLTLKLAGGVGQLVGLDMTGTHSM